MVEHFMSSPTEVLPVNGTGVKPRGIAQVKLDFPLPLFMISRGLGQHAHRSARCPFHDDQHNSFSVFEGQDGDWKWKCHAGCGGGDAIDFLCKLDGIPVKAGLERYRKESKSNHVAGLIGQNIDPKMHTARHASLPQQSRLTEFNWPDCVQALAYDGDLINALAKSRGYDPATIWTLLQHELIGQFDRHFAFPVTATDDRQQVIGCHYLLPDKHEWRYTAGCSATPLLVGVGPEYHATESTWDGIALVDQLGFENATVVITRGASNACKIRECIPDKVIVSLWPQNDKAGQKWVEDAVRSLPGGTSICKTPPQFKDVNEWFLNA